jgi:hypothetical protein
MGTGYTRNDTVNNIADGNVINASDLDGEFDALQSAFDASTGHTHDGTTAEGAPIEVTGPAQEYVSTNSEFRPKANNTYDLGSASNQWKDLYVDGTANLDTVDIDAGNIDGTTIGGTTPAAGTFTTLSATGNVTLGDAATDTVTITADVASNVIPSVDNTYDLGAVGSEWRNLFIDGTANIDSLVADTADINGGTIDGVTIGGASAGAGTFTTATATTGNITTVNATTVDTTNIEVTNLKAKDGTAAGSIADSTGVVTIASSVLTTTDINGGTIDGTTIGGASAAAGTFTTATATTGNITTVNATTVDSTNVEVTNIKAKDGTASATIANSTGVMTIASSVLTTADINGGTIDGVTIGGASAGAGTFTTLTATGNVTLGDAATDTVTITADVASSLIPSADNTYDLGASGSEWRNLFIDGTANIDSLAADAATIAGNLVVNGNTTLGNAATDTVTITADVASNIIPSADNTYDLGASGSEWKDLFIDGTANIDSLVADTADINGGTIDGAVIGGSTPAAISGTTGTFSGNVSISDKIIHTGDTNTAIRFPAADTVTVETSGSERLRVTSTGTVGILTTTPAATLDVAGTGAIKVPVGTEAQRPTPAKGQLRFNDDIDKFEGYDGTEWGTVGGGGGFFKGENGSVGDATTGPGDIFRINEQELNTSVTISGTENASCTGPLAVASGVTLTVSAGGTLAVI